MPFDPTFFKTRFINYLKHYMRLLFEAYPQKGTMKTDINIF